jgi:carbamoyltransferase
MYKISAVALNLHDHNTYDGEWHNQRERHTRFKHNLPYHAEAYAHQSDILNSSDYRLNDIFTEEYFKKPDDGVLAFTYTFGGIRKSKEELLETILKGHDAIFEYQPKKLFDYYFNDGIYFIDHHQSHATYAFMNSGYEESDILAIDGIGSKYRCVFFDKNQNLIDLSDELPIGWLWNHMSNLTGFGTLGAGKLMGLVAYGKFSDYYYEIFQMICEEEITEKKQEKFSHIDLDKHGIEDLAFTLQQFTIDKIKEHVYPLKTSENICIAGGVSYNGYVNEELTKHYTNVFVPPAAGDEGQAIGAYQHADYMLNNNKHIAQTYSGLEYKFEDGEELNIKEIAQSIADGKIIGWFQGKSESGNRALGNRSILADPRNPEIKNIINHTIKGREDFRPFAPSCLEEHYQEYFDTNQTSPFMSRIVQVKSDKIPGVTHIDNTARVQTVNKEFNPKFWDLINEFYKITGIPMLLNTSFNRQEPIVEEPWHALRTFKESSLDILVINNKVIRK